MSQSSRRKKTTATTTTTTATATATNRVLPLLLLLLLLAKLPTAVTTTTTSSLEGDCSTLFSECFETDLCEACLTTIDGVGIDAASEASALEEAATCTVYEFEDDNLCDGLGVSYCCSAELSGEDCFTDGATLDYWECLLGRNGCVMQDMPCISELTATGSDEDEMTTSARDIEGASSSSANSEDAEDNGVPKARGGGGSWVGQVAGALGLVVSVAAMLV